MTDLSKVTNDTLREALETILRPTTSTTEKIVRCSALQEDLQKNIATLTESLHKVSTKCAERAGRVPQALDTHVAWVKQARTRAGNIRKSLDGTKLRLQKVLANLEKMAATEEDHAKRTEQQMNAIVTALEKQGNTSFAAANAVSAVNSATTTATAPATAQKSQQVVAVEEEETKKQEAEPFSPAEAAQEEKKEEQQQQQQTDTEAKEEETTTTAAEAEEQHEEPVPAAEEEEEEKPAAGGKGKKGKGKGKK